MIDNDKKHELLAGYIDGELSEEEKLEFESELEHNSSLRLELEEFKKLKSLTNSMKYADLPDEVWDGYWQSIYKRIERGIGWILFSLGAIFLLCFGIFKFLSKMYYDPNISIFVKISVAAFVIGLITLLVSYIRERFFAYKRERYTEVMK